MALTTGIVGLPNVGKSTLFNAITQAGAESANYPFCTIDPNVGIVNVPDERLDALTEMYHPKETIPTTFEFTDIAGLVKGASQGEGLGNQFLANIRQVDAISHVVRCFEDKNVTHVSGKVDPVDDIETINLELILADLDSVNKRFSRVEKLVKQKDKEAILEFSALEKLKAAFESEQPARNVDLTEEEKGAVKTLNLLTIKPVLYVANVSEDDLVSGEENEFVKQVKALAEKEGSEVVVISAKIESEIAELEGEEKQTFLEDLGITKSGLDQLIEKSYKLLGLATYFTAGEKEVRAWTFRQGIKAPQAAGIIHSDFERGFIRAEVVSFEDLMAAGSLGKSKENGKLRLEGKDYIVQDGDVVHFRFNV
ncbi:GTP-binding protein YchF [Pullulanibacillus pueri]|uniref:Ribosome-binding ATPase YchF n=1 Tax=Pullulanibacillus pueri TaxID=1437324 RepID=A0A8J2ZUV8_9BACL|nr:redox-regulated ATPase YchF [Pullulanibacillus pueri]MBM7682181.1 GTP-binding protein YchF [Pullulanibacillus pueri]GGH80350.1 ribosome-binding ATPase YchF [Pullulanibacillus pueri]